MMEYNINMLADFGRMAFKSEMDKRRKKLEERGFTFAFYPDAPLTMVVRADNAQMEMDEDEHEDMMFVLKMHTWGDVRYRFQGGAKTDIPEDLLNRAKAGFRKLAGAYFMMQHYLEIQARMEATEK